MENSNFDQHRPYFRLSFAGLASKFLNQFYGRGQIQALNSSPLHVFLFYLGQDHEQYLSVSPSQSKFFLCHEKVV